MKELKKEIEELKARVLLLEVKIEGLKLNQQIIIIPETYPWYPSPYPSPYPIWYRYQKNTTGQSVPYEEVTTS